MEPTRHKHLITACRDAVRKATFRSNCVGTRDLHEHFCFATAVWDARLNLSQAARLELPLQVVEGLLGRRSPRHGWRASEMKESASKQARRPCKYNRCPDGFRAETLG